MPYPISRINRATLADCEAAIDDKDKILGLLCQAQRPGFIIILCVSANLKLDVMISNVPSSTSACLHLLELKGVLLYNPSPLPFRRASF
jgi:hypothetical protein